MKYRFLAALFAGGVLSGCVATDGLHEIAVDTNRLVADAANDQTMLNILRAKDRMPMHFTSFTVLRGNLSMEGTASLGLSLPADGLQRVLDAAGVATGSTLTRGASTATPSLGGTVSTNPSFDLQVYDTKQFQQGILAPVNESVIEYYLQNGWPEDMLTALFVSRIDVASTDGSVTPFSIINSADSTDFGNFIKTTQLVSRKKPGSATPLIPLSQFGAGLALSDLDKLDGSKFDVVTTPQGTVVVRVKSDSNGIGFTRLADAIRAYPGAGALKTLTLTCPDAPAPTSAMGQTDRASTECTAGGAAKPNITVDVFFRSPEAILYFLGSYVRCDLQEEGACKPYTTGKATKLIQIGRGYSGDSLFAVRHRDGIYSMPAPTYSTGEPNHRGSQAMGLVQQLINLQKSADTLPVSSSIRLIP